MFDRAAKTDFLLRRMTWLDHPFPKDRGTGIKSYTNGCTACGEESAARQACSRQACPQPTRQPTSGLKFLQHIDALERCDRFTPACAPQRLAHTACALKRCTRAGQVVAWLASRYNLANLDALRRNNVARLEHAAAVVARAKALLAGCRTAAGREAARQAVFAVIKPRLVERQMDLLGGTPGQRLSAMEIAFGPDAALVAHLRRTSKEYVDARKLHAKDAKALDAFRAKVARMDVPARLAELKAAAAEPARFEALHATLLRALPRPVS